MVDIKKQAENFAMVIGNIPKILNEISNGVYYDETLGYSLRLSGWYNDGHVVVYVGSNANDTVNVIIKGRHDILAEFDDLDNLEIALMRLNAERFKYWSNVEPEFDAIDADWLPLLIEAGLITESITWDVNL